MFRPISHTHHPLPAWIAASIAVVLMTVATINVGSASEAQPAIETPTAWEYQHETSEPAVPQSRASTDQDFALAAGFGILATVGLAMLAVSDRGPAPRPERSPRPVRQQSAPRPQVRVRPATVAGMDVPTNAA